MTLCDTGFYRAFIDNTYIHAHTKRLWGTYCLFIFPDSLKYGIYEYLHFKKHYTSMPPPSFKYNLKILCRTTDAHRPKKPQITHS